MAVKPMILTTRELRTAIAELEGVELPQRTLANWVGRDLLQPSVAPGAKGGVATPALWSLADLARVRLILQMRRGGVVAPRVRLALVYIEAELRDVLRLNSTAKVVVAGRRAYVVRPGQPDIEVPSGQTRFTFKIADVVRGNEAAARRAQAA